MTAADQVIQNAAGKFNTPARAIIAGCKQSCVTLRLDGDHFKAKGDRETIAAWSPMIQRHRPEIVAALAGQIFTPADDAGELATLAADYQELTTCIIELCQLAGYTGEARERMLEARQNLYPFQIAIECAYFRLQVTRAKTGTYWDALQPSQTPGNATASPDTREARVEHPARRTA